MPLYYFRQLEANHFNQPYSEHMQNLKIATWNVNSIRVRLPHVIKWLDSEKPDILALQELKLEEAKFPYDEFKAAGYHAAVSGQKTYNGVALLSRNPGQQVVNDFQIEGFVDPQRRILAATYAGVRVINLYVPNGDTTTSSKYQYKLTWLNHLKDFLKREYELNKNIIVLGDFNIAPATIDVHDPKLWEGKVLCTDPERNAFHHLITLGFRDCVRHLYPDEQIFSWWDYRLNAFKRNLGLRIDHILASHALNQFGEVAVDRTPRGWERPSDHAPVMANFVL